MTESELVEISHLGAQGDGVVERAEGPLFVPGGLPGETWCFGAGEPTRKTASPDRQKPVCQHSSECGGCVAQHMAPVLYEAWKMEALTNAFSHRGIEVTPEKLCGVGLGKRRRTTFGFQRSANGVAFGYHRAASNEIVNISECPVLVSKIASVLADLREISSTFAVAKKIGRMTVTELDDGLDIAIEAASRDLSPTERNELTKRAVSIGAVVFTFNGVPVVETGSAVLTINGARLSAPPDVFLQATSDVEVMVSEMMSRATKRAKCAADLFCGIGTFTFPLAKRAKVTAFDGNKAAISGLCDAIKRNQGYKPIVAQQRDLFRDPLSVRELRAFDTVVINPPRAGALEQCKRLANSDVRTIFMVACSPATLARDARELLDGGYELASLTPIDQFVFSAHLESVAVFVRRAVSKR